MPRARLLACVALVSLLAACADDPAPPFAPAGTGTLTGRVFADVDNNGAYTPVGDDSVLAGVRVQLRDRGTTNVLAEATTTATGEFTFQDVTPGTHDVVFLPDATTGDRVQCGGRATVFVGEQAFVPLGLRRGCVIRIQAAKALAAGSRVTIAGVVTVAQGTFRGDNLYVQEASGQGIQVFGVPGALARQVGDSIEVTGELGAFRTELQVVNPSVAANVRRGGTPLPAKPVTVAQLAGIGTGTAGDVGRLVRVSRVRVGAFSAGGGRNATITPANATDGASSVIRLDGNALAAIGTARFDPAKCYDITGVVGLFDNGVQLKPRSPADVAEVACS